MIQFETEVGNILELEQLESLTSIYLRPEACSFSKLFSAQPELSLFVAQQCAIFGFPMHMLFGRPNRAEEPYRQRTNWTLYLRNVRSSTLGSQKRRTADKETDRQKCTESKLGLLILGSRK